MNNCYAPRAGQDSTFPRGFAASPFLQPYYRGNAKCDDCRRLVDATL
jgi:hypothetical protein